MSQVAGDLEAGATVRLECGDGIQTVEVCMQGMCVRWLGNTREWGSKDDVVSARQNLGAP